MAKDCASEIAEFGQTSYPSGFASPPNSLIKDKAITAIPNPISREIESDYWKV